MERGTAGSAQPAGLSSFRKRPSHWWKCLGDCSTDAAALSPAIPYRVREVDAGVEPRLAVLLRCCREPCVMPDHARQCQAVRGVLHPVAEQFDEHFGGRPAEHRSPVPGSGQLTFSAALTSDGWPGSQPQRLEGHARLQSEAPDKRPFSKGHIQGACGGAATLNQRCAGSAASRPAALAR